MKNYDFTEWKKQKIENYTALGRGLFQTRKKKGKKNLSSSYKINVQDALKQDRITFWKIMF